MFSAIHHNAKKIIRFSLIDIIKTDNLMLFFQNSKMSLALQTYLQEYNIHGNLYLIPSSVLKTLDVKQWKFNRPPDWSRLEEIRSWISENKRMDGILNLAYIVGEGLVCFDQYSPQF